MDHNISHEKVGVTQKVAAECLVEAGFVKILASVGKDVNPVAEDRDEVDG